MLQSFDEYATNYDKHFSESLIGKAQRRQVWDEIQKNIEFKGLEVLELNCGTGMDALWMERNGATVTATDISTSMIEVANKKLLLETKNIKFLVKDMRKLDEIEGKFQFVLSNFGGMNCLDKEELIKVLQGIKSKTEKGGFIAIVIMGRKCIWERIFYSIKGEKQKGRRRLNEDGVEANLESQVLKTWYYSPKEIVGMLPKEYKPISIKPIGLFVPPSYLEPLMLEHPKFFDLMKIMDTIFRRFSFFSDYSDHYLLIAKKNV